MDWLPAMSSIHLQCFLVTQERPTHETTGSRRHANERAAGMSGRPRAHHRLPGACAPLGRPRAAGGALRPLRWLPGAARDDEADDPLAGPATIAAAPARGAAGLSRPV